ncbi:MAG: glycosyltransferase family 39 protein [Chloroflexi bacterium]|nr:glycosyltransferase family 39 protein [Chloroflexota bacterium]
MPISIDKFSPIKQWIIVGIFLLFFVGLGILSVKGKSATYDEPRHLRYGQNILNGNSDRFDDSKMPFSALNALPEKLGDILPVSDSIKSLLSSLFAARLVTLLVSTSVAFLVFFWSRSLYGFIPGLISLLLYIFDPNIIAHSQLVTTDLYALGTFFLSMYTLWSFARKRTILNGLGCAFALGLSCLAKYSSLPLLGISLLALFLYDLRSMKAEWDLNHWKTVRLFAAKYIAYIAAGAAISILVINIGFLFNKTFTRFGDYQFRSKLFQSIQDEIPVLNGLPVPVPYPYLEGLDWVIYRERTGDGYGKIYLLGQLRDGQGFMGYYLVASLLKVPIAAQILVIASLGVYFFDKDRRRSILSNEIFLLLPVVFYGIYFNFFNEAQIGIRYYLIVFPFLYVLAGGLFTRWMQFFKWQIVTSLGLLLYLVVSVLSYYPYYLTYFNELVWNKTQTYKYLADSNLDWGQSKAELDEYFAEHQNAKDPQRTPEPGLFVVSANRLVGIVANPERFRWLRESFEPVDTIANYYFVYQISPEQVDKLCQTTDYCHQP